MPPSSEGDPAEQVPLKGLLASLTVPGDVPGTAPQPAPPTRKRRRPTDDERRASLATEELELSNEKTRVEISGHEARIARDKEDHRLIWKFRKWLAIAGVVIVVVWQFAVLAVVVAHGANAIHLSDAVTIALATTTTANVIGLLVIVMKFVFSPTPAPPDPPAAR